MKDIRFNLPFFLLAIVVSATVWSNWDTLSDRIALGGYSPIDWVNHIKISENFQKDSFLTQLYKHSLFMHCYLGLNDYLGLPPDVAVYGVLLFEVLFLSFAVGYLAHTVFPSKSAVFISIVVLFVIASSLGLTDLSRICIKPYFAGLYYNAANGCRLLAIAMALRNRWWFAGGLLVFSAASHPIMGLLGIAFVASIILCRRKETFNRRFLLQTLFYAALLATWLGSVLQQSHVGEGEIPIQEWLKYQKALSVHWFPHDFGTLTDFHGHHLLPFICFMLLFYHYLPQGGLEKSIVRAWGWGVGAMIALTGMGIVFSTWTAEVFLIKLNLQRASELAVWASLPIVVQGLLSDLTRGAWFKRPAAATLMVSPFVSSAIVPALPVLLLVTPTAWAHLKKWQLRDNAEKCACAVYLMTVFTLLGYIFLSGHFSTNLVYYHGRHLAWIGGIGLSLVAWQGCARFSPKVGSLLILCLLTAASLHWVYSDHQTVVRNHERAAAYREVQDWARENTAGDALFMVDPVIFYGWRDFSQRSSFGNLREWLLQGWSYDSNPSSYRSGLERFEEFGLDASPYLAARPTRGNMNAFYEAVQERFYTLTDDWRTGMQSRHGIDYFVMEKAKLKETSMNRVFENSKFVVLTGF